MLCCFGGYVLHVYHITLAEDLKMNIAPKMYLGFFWVMCFSSSVPLNQTRQGATPLNYREVFI